MKPKPRNLARRRGAALVEAAVAIPVMLVFLGVTKFAHDSYDEKIALQMSARSEILYNASHNCEATAPASMAQQLGANVASSGTAKEQGQDDPSGGAGSELDGPSSKLRDSEKQGVSRSWNLVRTSRTTETDPNGSAVQEQKTVKLRRTITANSAVACNEKRFDNDWTAIFGFIKGFAQSGGGFID